MIVGIGTDIVEVARIEAIVARRGNAFAERILTADEMTGLSTQHSPARYIAKRFAAKEAALKALGTGLRNGIRWADLEVTHDALGKPLLRLAGAAQQRLIALQGASAEIASHITLSDEQRYVVAFVIIERS